MGALLRRWMLKRSARALVAPMAQHEPQSAQASIGQEGDRRTEGRGHCGMCWLRMGPA